MGASWQAFYAHLCAASIIRAMPETEIPPAMRGDLYFAPALPPGSECERKTREKIKEAAISRFFEKAML